MEGGQLVFLVGRVHAVVVEAEADHQRVHLQVALEGADDGDRAARARHHGLLAPFGVERAARARQRLGREGELQGRAAAVRRERGRAVGAYDNFYA